MIEKILLLWINLYQSRDLLIFVNISLYSPWLSRKLMMFNPLHDYRYNHRPVTLAFTCEFLLSYDKYSKVKILLENCRNFVFIHIVDVLIYRIISKTKYSSIWAPPRLCGLVTLLNWRLPATVSWKWYRGSEDVDPQYE